MSTENNIQDFTDLFGIVIIKNDVVCFNPPYYKGIIKGKVKHFSEKTVRVSYIPEGKQYTDEVSISPNNLVVDLSSRV